MNSYLIHFETVGCKLNQIETESIAKFCSDQGFAVSMKPLTAAAKIASNPVISIINTCTVTAKAEQKSRRIMRLLLSKFPDMPVIVTGCYAQVEQKQIESESPFVIVVPGSIKDTLADFPLYLKNFFENNKTFSGAVLVDYIRCWEPLKNRLNFSKQLSPEDLSSVSFKLSTDTFYAHSRASIKIQDGCDNACSYCRIWLARGKPISLPVVEVLNRVKQIESSGQKEVVITGVNLSLYKGFYKPEGTETAEYFDLAQLMEYLLKNTSIISFRISSLYPERIDDTLCRVLDNKRIRPHFHISVQSGSDKILTAMRRSYTSKTICDAVDRLRKIKPDAFIACDVIAGFPGETDEDFIQTMEMCKKCRFTWIHAFPFSARPGTAAAKMKNQVPQRISKVRVKELTDFAQQSKYAYTESFVGKIVKAIIEKHRTNCVRAVSENFLHIKIEGDYKELNSLAGEEINVCITKPQHTYGAEDEIEALGKLYLLR
ncbi:MAG: tRNA (N(6)-L-threonylcarbamoyladenosine(37)-C(2))-methylthiotransferase MtaB [Spirochaetaceae bacterium]|nr:tRNA (N(6)-L-threonylcarbamoyladenosine(37)-C(2))-methylthiotransferase MtaB [Spirochaetaceae bacterium]